jgi:hypothetical protein
VRGVFGGPIPYDAHQFGIGHLFHARNPVIQFGRLIRLDVNFDDLAHFRRFTRSEVARRYRFRDGGRNVSGIAGAGDRRQREPHGAILARRVNSFEAKLEGDCIAT